MDPVFRMCESWPLSMSREAVATFVWELGDVTLPPVKGTESDASLGNWIRLGSIRIFGMESRVLFFESGFITHNSYVVKRQDARGLPGYQETTRQTPEGNKRKSTAGSSKGARQSRVNVHPGTSAKSSLKAAIMTRKILSPSTS